MLLPIRSKNPPESFPYVTICLILINVLVYACTTNGLFIHEESLKSGGLTYTNFGAWHILTSMFLHLDVFHILGNMWFLYLFGFAVEGRLRSFKFLLIYFLSGAAGDVAQTLMFGAAHPDIPSLGASGAIMGIVGAAIYLFPHGQVDFFWMFWWRFGIATWPVWGVALFYLGYDMLFAFIGADSGVGHLAHLGGAVAGFLICALMRPRRDTEFVSVAKATLAETKDLSILSPAEMAELYGVNPTDANLVLHWMHKSLSKSGQADPTCQAAFMKMLPQMIAGQDARSVGFCVAWLNSAPGTVSARPTLQVAGLLEHQGDANTAIRLYNSILNDPKSSKSDHEAALFRMGMVYESMLQDFRSAEWAYTNVVENWPMSPMADQARARLVVVRKRIPIIT